VARPNVKLQLELPGDDDDGLYGVECYLRLVADVAGSALGYTSNVGVGGVRTERPTTEGLVTFDAVRPNSGEDGITAPEGTVYELTTRWPDGSRTRDYLNVPSTAGDVWVPDVLAPMPASLLPAAAAAAADLQAEVDARVAGDDALSASLAAETSARSAGLAAEASARSAGLAAVLDAVLLAVARDPGLIVAGAVTKNADSASLSAAVVWPDGTPGTYTALTLSTAFPGAVDAYEITYGAPATRTYRQPLVTRDAFGAVADAPEIEVI
jgi:hypothetical protein